MLIENSNLSQSFLFSKNSALSKKAPHSHNIIATLLQSVITYCYQKNPLRVRTKPHIRLCYAWSLQRFKSLPSILCEIAVSAKLVTCRKPVISVKTPFRPAIWTVPGVQRSADLWCTFGSFRTSEKNKPVPFRKLSDKQKVCPCRGSTLRVPLLPCRNFRGFANLKSAPLRGISLLFEKVGQNMGRRGAAPYLYTQSVYQCSPLRGNSGGSAAIPDGYVTLMLHFERITCKNKACAVW